MSVSGPILDQVSAAETESRVSGAVAPLRRDDFDRDVWCLMGLAVDAADITRAVAEIDDAARTGRPLSFVTPNVNFLVRAMRDETARREILNAGLSLVDGAPLVAMAKLLGVPVRSRVAGSDLFDALRRRPAYAGRKLKVFFFGGRSGAAEKAVDVINKERSGLEAVGWHNPGYGDVESMSSDEVIAKINACEPDFVLVALGAAKGQSWIERNRGRLSAPVTAHLGAVIDFIAGSVARAPAWMQRSGLEWAWRIKEEPSLWRRYFDDAAGLASLALQGLAPQLGRAGPVLGEASAELEHAPDQTLIRLSGVIGHGSLGPIRNAFRAASASGKSVQLDLEGVHAVDRAFLGQVLMLEKQLGQAGARIWLSGASASLDRLFRANRMDYPRIAGVGGEARTDADSRRTAV
jgi:N-acetylglucosaminyldiphosphoundecaprenol N-acetyl-beta-D-mannosaminyltransferase